MTRWILTFICALIIFSLQGQGTVYTPKLGLVAGVQSFGSTESLPLISYHASLAFEGYKEDAKNSFYGQLGLHNRGSSERVFVPQGLQGGNIFRQNVRLTNISGQVGVKNRLQTEGSRLPYYSFGLRLEYTLSDNFQSFEEFAGFLPIQLFINKWNYGASLAFGYEFTFSELFGGIIEASVNPDLSFQYNQPESFTIVSPVNGMSTVAPRRQVRNVTFELSFGLRLINKVVYIN